jgi:hypothetical protein
MDLQEATLEVVVFQLLELGTSKEQARVKLSSPSLMTPLTSMDLLCLLVTKF